VSVLADIAAALARTWRLEIRGEEYVAGLRAQRVPILFAVWHGRLLAPLWHRRGQGITLLVSEHRDGLRLARAAAAWGYRVVAGSSTRGGLRGLRGIVRCLRRDGVAALTPDGPRGPAEVPKPGAVTAAQHAGAAIIPVAAAATAVWRLRSWDRFQVPRPFASVRVVYGSPIRVPPGRAGRERGLAQLAGLLMAVEREAQWSW
jgi:hypothetical protein